MSAIAQFITVAVGLGLVVMCVLESTQYARPRLFPIFLTKPADVPAVRMWSINVGFYNLCFGLAALIGVALLHVGDPIVGRTLILFTCASMVFLGGVLFASEHRLWASALAQSIPPLVVLVLVLL